jgi:hypothetical protein
MPALLAWSFVWLALLIPLALVGGFLLLLFVVALVEKHPVHAFDPTPLEATPPDLPPYARAMNDAAARCGYAYGGTYAHAKGGTYRLWSSLWMAPDRRVLANVSGGTILNMPHKKTFLYSRRADGKYLVTTDEFHSGDTSGVQEIESVLNATFEELLSEHLRRVHALGSQGIPPFEQATAVEAWRHVELDVVLPTVERGLGRWVNPDRTVWVYSLKGALRLCTVGLFGGVIKNSGQRHRLDRPRPGAGVAHRGFEVVPPAAPTSPPASERDFLP